MFKKGDIVVRKKYEHGKFKEGDIAKILEIGSQSYIVLEKDYEGFTHSGESLRLATPEELEQFKKHILKMDNKLIGYKLKSNYDKYTKAASAITSTANWEYNIPLHGIMFTHDSTNAKLLRDAGVLDLWFEPVYKEEDIIIGNTYKVEFDDKGYAKINGTKYSKSELIQALQVLELPEVKGLEVGCSGQYRIDLVTVKKILSRL